MERRWCASHNRVEEGPPFPCFGIFRQNLHFCEKHQEYEPLSSPCFDKIGFVVEARYADENGIPALVFEEKPLEEWKIKTPEKSQWHETLWDAMIRQAAIVRKFRD